MSEPPDRGEEWTVLTIRTPAVDAWPAGSVLAGTLGLGMLGWPLRREISPLQRIVPCLEADDRPGIRQRQVAGGSVNDREGLRRAATHGWTHRVGRRRVVLARGDRTPGKKKKIDARTSGALPADDTCDPRHGSQSAK
jgi:hypothetical protein